MDAALQPEDVAYAGVLGQRALLRGRRVTAVELLDLCLARVDRLDSTLNAFRTVFRDRARAEAAAADAALAAGDDRPLLGVPVAVKDNVAIAGHAAAMGTGSPEPVAVRDAEQVRRLRDAGAVVVGATHLPELALWPFTESATWGETRNPWSPAHTAGGSSGGSAAAVAAGMVAVATASDGGGSIRIPAVACGLVGLKPQVDRVALEGEHWLGLSAAGCLTRTVADQALVLSVMTGGQIGASSAPPAGLRVAWSTKGAVPTPVSPVVLDALTRTLDVLRGLGHTVERADPDHAKVFPSFVVRYGRGAHSDLVRLVDPRATEPRTRAVTAVGRRLPDSLVSRAQAWGAQVAARHTRLPGGADVLVTPVTPLPAARVGALTGMRTLALAGRVTPFTVPWNVSGQPAMAVPAGHTDDGLPLGVQLVARPGEEDLLLALAAQLEAATSFADRRPPLGVSA